MRACTEIGWRESHYHKMLFVASDDVRRAKAIELFPFFSAKEPAAFTPLERAKGRGSIQIMYLDGRSCFARRKPP